MYLRTWLTLVACLLQTTRASVTTTLLAVGTTYIGGGDIIDTVATPPGAAELYIGSPNTSYYAIVEYSPDDLPSMGSTVTAAYLNLTYVYGPGFTSERVAVFPNNHSFVITECTWNSASFTTTWVYPGEFIYEEEVDTYLTTAIGSEAVEMAVSITAVQRWVDRVDPTINVAFFILTSSIQLHGFNKDAAYLTIEADPPVSTAASTVASTAASTAASTEVVTTTTTTTTAPSTKSSINLGLVIGATVGGIAGAIGITAAVMYFRGSHRIKYARLHTKHSTVRT